ncbi:MAG: alpha/beta fold hydrolase [Persicimonas sp.]
MGRIFQKMAGHAWTIAPALRHRVFPRTGPAADDWSMTLEDPRVGPVEITGRYARRESRTLVVLVHGLGGHAESAYMVDAAAAVDRAGLSCLRLCLRGAGGTGEDIYHAGLTEELHAALSHPDFEGYEHLVVIGFSLGGHVALRAAVEGGHRRLRAVGAVCPPLDLREVQRWLDAPARKIYRAYILNELRAMYARVARRGRAPTPMARIRPVRTLLEWDALTVVPRFGFDDPDDYYETMSVGPQLEDVQVPALIVAGRHDPMIPAHVAERFLEDSPALSEVCWVDDGGHVFFPRGVETGLSDEERLVGQMLGWFERRCRAARVGQSTVGSST